MIYIPHIKKRIDELAPRWDKGELTQKELFEFYDLLDEVVREARENRSHLVGPDPDADPPVLEDNRPETFLLKLFKLRIENVVFQFFQLHSPKRYSDAILEAKSRKTSITNTSLFREWNSYAQDMVISIILGDYTSRIDRREQVKKFLESSGTTGEKNRLDEEFLKDKHLSINSKRLYSNAKALKEQQDKNNDYNYIPWAQQCALDIGHGYNPDLKKMKLEDLQSRLEESEDFIKRWEGGEFRKDIKTNHELEQYLKEEYGNLPSGIKNKIKSLNKKEPNLINYLFGIKGGKEGVLSYRLRDLSKLLINRENKNKSALDPDKVANYDYDLDDVNEPDFDFYDRQEGFGEPNYNKFYGEMLIKDHPAAEESYLDIDLDNDENNRKLEVFGLKKAQRPVFIKKIIEKKLISTIAKELGTSERNIKKHLANIKNNPQIKNILSSK